ncbi:SGNH/GDSL hydrolase family protein [Embleya sp. AB8]|uniref:SGNH/GDSL hydrolase family protein n=1 Tax=Embleya sp. AB8 TaxID=3156304 RepID=UPI003C7376FC
MAAPPEVAEPPRRPPLRAGGGRRVVGLMATAALAFAFALPMATPALATPKPPDTGTGTGPPPSTPPRTPPPPAGSSTVPDIGELVDIEGTNSVENPAGPGGPAYGANEAPPVPGGKVFNIVFVGDSWMSGEGAGDYYNAKGELVPPKELLVLPNGGYVWVPAKGKTEEDYKQDMRHRSANAAALLAVDAVRKANPGVTIHVTFNASSGATTSHFYNAQHDNNRDNPAQRTGIDANTDLVVVGLGGNDVDFGPIMEKALTGKDLQALKDLIARSAPLLAERDAATEFADGTPQPPQVVHSPPSTVTARLIQIVRDTHLQAPHALVALTTYAQGLASNVAPTGLLRKYLSVAEVNEIQPLAHQLAQSIKRASAILAANGVQCDYLNVENALNGHLMGSRDPWVNELVIDGTAFAQTYSPFNALEQSFHPNRKGQQALAKFYASLIVGELSLNEVPVNTPFTQPAHPNQPGLPPPTVPPTTPPPPPTQPDVITTPVVPGRGGGHPSGQSSGPGGGGAPYDAGWVAFTGGGNNKLPMAEANMDTYYFWVPFGGTAW